MHRIRVNNLVFKVREDDYERITRLLDEGGEIVEEEQTIVEDVSQVEDRPTKKKKRKSKKKK